jgi:hypothetical protein
MIVPVPVFLLWAIDQNQSQAAALRPNSGSTNSAEAF